jgi:hypothetical protein
MTKTVINYKSADPYPTISDNITLLIDNKINELNFDYFIEYGAGNSTRYFLNKMCNAQKKITYISMEYNYNWFLHTVEAIKSDFIKENIKSNSLKLTPWSYGKCKKYFEGKNLDRLSIPENLKRLPKGRKKMMGKHNSKMLIYRFSKYCRPHDGVFYANIADTLTLYFYLKRDFMKDQYGESPIKNEYISTPFEIFSKNLHLGEKVTAIFIIDGGPRSDILERILNMEEKYDNFFPVIYLCDANKNIYSQQVKRRPQGVYYEGTNKTLDKRVLYEHNAKASAEKMKFWYGREDVAINELIEKEVWHYNSVERKK